MDAQTMQVHYEKHHAGYVKNLNEALESSSLKGMVIEDILISVEASPVFNKVRNNAGGHYNHTLFWNLMTPGGKPLDPEGPLMGAIQQTFGSMDGLEKQFKDAAMGVFGSGWAWLCAGPGRSLFVSQTPNQDNPIMRNMADRSGVPLLAIDVWEHAYYLKHQNRRADYIDAFWQIIDWEVVAHRYSAV
jgi:Fe-Mn family superoxide dismutase